MQNLEFHQDSQKNFQTMRLKINFLLIPGVITPSEVMNASNEGHKCEKSKIKAFNAISQTKKL